MSGVFFALFLLVAIAFPLLLYFLTEQEASNTQVMDRTDAERIAKERGGRPGRQQDASDESEDEWGTLRREKE